MKLVPDHLHGLDERLRVGGVAGEDPHRDRAAVPVGEQPVFDLLFAALAVAGVPERGQLAVAAFHPRGRQVEQGHPALAQVPARQGGLDLVLPGCEPVHRRVDLVGGRPGHPQVRAEGDVVPPADRGQLGRGPGYPGDDQREGQVPVPRWRAQKRREAQRAGLCHDRGHMPVRQRPGHLQAFVRVDHGLAGQRQPHRLDRLIGQVRQVGQGFLADLAAVPVGPAQQVPLVDPLRPVLQHLMAT